MLAFRAWEFGKLLVRDAGSVTSLLKQIHRQKLKLLVYGVSDAPGVGAASRPGHGPGLARALTRSHDWTPFDRSDNVLIGRLRRKLYDAAKGGKLIKAVRNVGYVLAAEVKRRRLPKSEALAFAAQTGTASWMRCGEPSSRRLREIRKKVCSRSG